MTQKKKNKAKEFKKLVKEADDAFQMMVRYRDNFKCITCGRQFPFGERTLLHAGHFISRVHKATRWDEQNVHAQCAKCNLMQSRGSIYTIHAYEKALKWLYGDEIVEDLIQRSRQVYKPSVIELEEIIQNCKEFIENKKNEYRQGADILEGKND